MQYAIPSELRTISAAGTTITDRLYFGDMGGQLWSIDFNPAATGTTASNYMSPRLLADLGINAGEAAPTKSSHRRFFYPPAVATTSPNTYAIAIGSGQRSNPLYGNAAGETPVEDKFYLVYDDGTTPATPYTESNLDNVTNGNVPANTTKKGWRIGLNTKIEVNGNIVTDWGGEKIISSPLIFDNKVLFLSFVPESIAQSNSCAPANTTNLFYAVNLADASPSDEIVKAKDDNPDGAIDETIKEKTPLIISASSLIVDDLNIITGQSGGGSNEECYEAMAGVEAMIKFCKTPSKVYWKETR